MKKYLKMIPLIIYPYAYIIFLVLFNLAQIYGEDPIFYSPFMDYVYTGIILLFNLYVIFIAIFNSVITSKGRYSAHEAAKMNLIIKALQIPAYVFHFILGVLGAFASVWGIGFIIVAVCVDLLTIILTGINSIGCTRKLKKDGVITKGWAILAGIGSFIYCIDVVIAIVYVVLSSRGKYKAKLKLSSAETNQIPNATTN